MAQTTLTTDDVLALLAENLRRMTALTAGLTPAQLQAAPAAGEWSFNDILAHLRACADMWGAAIERILAEDEPTLRAINPRTWMRQTDYPAQPFAASFRAFTEQRMALLARLERLAADDWARQATVTGTGKPLQRTVYFYARWLAEHERSHVKHMARMVGGMES